MSIAYPFENDKLLGAISEIGPNYIKAAFIVPLTHGQRFLHGQAISSGLVGDFVLVESQDQAILGKIVKIRLPEKERSQIEPQLENQEITHPIAEIQILSSIALSDGKVRTGVSIYPSLGARVFLASPEILKVVSNSRPEDKVSMSIAHLPGLPQHEVTITPEKLFGRHCAILGTTGGGKSWTVARLVEQTKHFKSKVILFDPTGEFWPLDGNIKSIYIGEDVNPPAGSSEVVVPYYNLTESDLLALFNPSGQSQAPKLRAAMKSLKLAHLERAVYTQGYIPKANQPKANYLALYKKHTKAIEGSAAHFFIANLTNQIQEECVWPSAQNNHNNWGGPDQAALGYVTQLLFRIEDMTNSRDLACLFNVTGKVSVFDEIKNFLEDPSLSCLRISFKTLSYNYHVREIVCNAIGRYLLNEARDFKFKLKPLVVFLDEAHQFLNKHLGDENTKFALDAFDLIAKEGRKYCLNVCIATQRPRDIPEGVLSQMGTLIVHRLINDKDREVVERASGDIDRSAAAFLPTLSQGQAVIVGVEFPAPLTVQILRPIKAPDSEGPKFQDRWR